MSFTDSEKNVIHQLFKLRRDIRHGFTGADFSDEILNKILTAAHHAPSVGFMQPWNFILIKEPSRRKRIHEMFVSGRLQELDSIPKEKKELYNSLKLEGILESTLNICVTCDRERRGSTGLGRSQQENMDLFSTVCAVQNMWLAARAEDIGMGWVSIMDKEELSDELELPKSVEPVAYLCVGPVDKFGEVPDLEIAGWEKRDDLDQLIFKESWGTS